MATIRFLLAFFCIAGIGKPYGNYGNMLKGRSAELRTRIVKKATGEIGVREIRNSNRGIRVEEYLAYVHLKPGNPWCAAFVSWTFGQVGCQQPRSGWSPDLFPASRLARSALPANVIGIYFPELKRIAHVGIVIRQEGDWVLSSEGNTNDNGSREGDGVYLKRRHIRTIAKYADWIGSGKDHGG